jgi:hypothetical protein
MKTYSNKISLIKNSRGIYCLDTSIGCNAGMQISGGCYNDCYAAKSAKVYGFDFSTTVLRQFKNKKHRQQTINQINKVKLDFIRIGCSGDPSENWEHCISILKQIKNCNKEIVIITRHWNLLTDEQLQFFSTLNICINTSVSALDKNPFRQVEQYERIKPFCKSILRIVSCNFNLDNNDGHKMFKIQSELFLNDDTIDTVFRPSKNNKLVLDGIVNVSTGLFNGNKQLMSKYNKKTFTGKCENCHEMCGVKINNLSHQYIGGVKLSKQLQIFSKYNKSL